MSKKNIVYIISFLNKSQVFEWTVEMLDTTKYNYSFILLHHTDSYFEEFLKSKGFETTRVNYKGKKDLISAIKSIYRIIKNGKTDIVHAHLFDAGIVGLFAARIAGVKQRFYTRHYSTLHHIYYPHAVKYDRFINYMATNIIAVSDIVRKVLVEQEDVKPEKIRIVHHGFKLSEFKAVSSERINECRNRNLTGISNGPIVGVVSRLIHWKGVQYIVPAFKKFVGDYPSAHLLMAGADGPYKAEIMKLLEELPSGSFTIIPFENDGLALFRLFDMFIHVPVDATSEAFGQVYIEALLSGAPSVFTLSGIACEFVKDHQNALVVPFNDSDRIYKCMVELHNNNEVRERIVQNGYEIVSGLFPVEVMKQVEELYS